MRKRIKKTMTVTQLVFSYWPTISEPPKKWESHVEIRLQEIDTDNARIKAEINWKNNQK